MMTLMTLTTLMILTTLMTFFIITHNDDFNDLGILRTLITLMTSFQKHFHRSHELNLARNSLSVFTLLRLFVIGKIGRICVTSNQPSAVYKLDPNISIRHQLFLNTQIIIKVSSKKIFASFFLQIFHFSR